ncbi:hypothetical protein E1B28_007415 [Marasmius oreades]|uniref:Nudix hydrolase domain-containing protein n=1 Tax=Marasmius oreades TaxID=181124 RepID=A0A9P7UTF8_9AGAR|nr:uncharacterized protein E1B28_007415 [Marasmius oreades]KAG7093767.1 hypothetical protein E1B28_007415 [Marasmius oreades]
MTSLYSSCLFNLSSPLTKTSLQHIRTVLTTQNKTYATPKASGNAAVLIPLCNVNNKPGILFQVRGKSLRAHSGEVGFPGGRADLTDTSHLHTALRETYEELGILPERVEMLGEIGPPEINLRGDMVVWPFVGFVHSATSCSMTLTDDEPLPSCDLASLRAAASRAEVDFVFHLPFSDLTLPHRLRSSLFRGNRPYWTVGVSDIVEDGTIGNGSLDGERNGVIQEDDSEIGPGRYGHLEVWGLTGWYLNLLMRRLKMYQ